MSDADGDKPLVWITGAHGLIGSTLVALCPSSFKARGLQRSDLDLTDFRAVERLFSSERPAGVIHCAAISKNPACEADPPTARLVNTAATAHLADLAMDIPFFFFSTDLVFDGEKGNYVESDAPNPLSTYAETKVAAEQAVQRNPWAAIVRISLNGGVSPTRDRGFNEEMQRAWRDGRTLSLFTDEFRCPTGADVTAKAVWELYAKGAGGIFHICGNEKLSRYEIGRLLAEKHPELQPKISASSRKDYKGPARPPDTSMDCTKVQQLLSFNLPKFSDYLKTAPAEF